MVLSLGLALMVGGGGGVVAGARVVMAVVIVNVGAIPALHREMLVSSSPVVV